jgi:hypothetical protein
MTGRRKNAVEALKIKREIVAAFMKSSLYFTIPLGKRLEFIKFFSQPTVYSSCDLNKSKRTGNRDLKPASLD